MACQWSRNVNTWVVSGIERLLFAYQWSRNVNTWLVIGVEMLIHELSVE